MKDKKYLIRVQAVRMLESGQVKARIMRELHISEKSLNLWYAKFKRGGEIALLDPEHRVQKTHEEKLQIVSECINKHLSLCEASRRYEITYATIKGWLKAYSQHGEAGLHRKNEAGTMARKRVYTKEQLDELERLRRRNEYLEAENALLKKVKALVEERDARLRGIGPKPSKD